MNVYEARKLIRELPAGNELKHATLLDALRIASEWIEAKHAHMGYTVPLLTDWHRAAIIVAIDDAESP